MSRSCHSATFSRPACALPRSTRASPEICSALIGLRLCGIALEPFWPPRNGSCTSRTSVRCRWRTSVARRSMPAPASAIALSSSAWRSRATTCVETGSRSKPEACQHALLELRAGGRVRAHRARDPAHRHLREGALQALGVAVRLERQARQLHAEGRRLGVHPVRAPHAQRLHVLARARRQRLQERAGAWHDRFARRLQLQRERRVEHVRGCQAEMDPAPRLAGRGGEHVDKRRHVVLGRALALVYRLDGERRPADRLQIGLGGAAAGTEQERQLLARRHLHLAPRLHARLVGPDRAQLGACVALDHVL